MDGLKASLRAQIALQFSNGELVENRIDATVEKSKVGEGISNFTADITNMAASMMTVATLKGEPVGVTIGLYLNDYNILDATIPNPGNPLEAYDGVDRYELVSVMREAIADDVFEEVPMKIAYAVIIELNC